MKVAIETQSLVGRAWGDEVVGADGADHTTLGFEAAFVASSTQPRGTPRSLTDFGAEQIPLNSGGILLFIGLCDPKVCY